MHMQIYYNYMGYPKKWVIEGSLQHGFVGQVSNLPSGTTILAIILPTQTMHY